MLTTLIFAAAVATSQPSPPSPPARATLTVSVRIVESCRFTRIGDDVSIYCNGKQPHRIEKQPARIEVEELGVIEGQRKVVVF